MYYKYIRKSKATLSFLLEKNWVQICHRWVRRWEEACRKSAEYLACTIILQQAYDLRDSIFKPYTRRVIGRLDGESSFARTEDEADTETSLPENDASSRCGIVSLAGNVRPINLHLRIRA